MLGCFFGLLKELVLLVVDNLVHQSSSIQKFLILSIEIMIFFDLRVYRVRESQLLAEEQHGWTKTCGFIYFVSRSQQENWQDFVPFAMGLTKDPYRPTHVAKAALDHSIRLRVIWR